jgi:hypothetical protein
MISNLPLLKAIAFFNLYFKSRGFNQIFGLKTKPIENPRLLEAIAYFNLLLSELHKSDIITST